MKLGTAIITSVLIICITVAGIYLIHTQLEIAKMKQIENIQKETFNQNDNGSWGTINE